MALNSNEQQEAYRVGAMFKLADQIGLMTDADVAGATTVATLITAVEANVLTLGSSETLREQLVRAINQGEDLGLYDDTAINGETTVAGVITLTGVPSYYLARAFYD